MGCAIIGSRVVCGFGHAQYVVGYNWDAAINNRCRVDYTTIVCRRFNCAISGSGIANFGQPVRAGGSVGPSGEDGRLDPEGPRVQATP